MTQEEIQQKAYEVYPLDLDRHLIIEGEPYDNNKEKREAYIKGLTDSKPSLPCNLDEAANDGWAVYGYRESPRGLYSTCYVDGFKAGAEWMAEQGETIDGEILTTSDCGWETIRIPKKLYPLGTKVTIQIRKKQ